MAKNDNLKDFLTDVADAIREKKGTEDLINPQDFSNEIKNLPSGGSGWTGHADAEGLRAIGWTEEDIAYYQQHGVNWNEEDDQYHLVSDDNKALYGVLTAANVSTYKDRIVYLPKIDTSNKTSMEGLFDRCVNMVAIPMLDTRDCTSFYTLFNRCYSLVCIPPLDSSNVGRVGEMFFCCYALSYIPKLNLSKALGMSSMFAKCASLSCFPAIEVKPTSMGSIFTDCTSLRTVNAIIDVIQITNLSGVFGNCYCLEKVYLKNLKTSITINSSHNFSKESLLYMIENEAATSTITITLESNAYTRLSADADIQAALTAHPNVSLAK